MVPFQLVLALLGVMALLLRVGLGLQLAGQSCAKNAGGAVMCAAADFSIVVLAFWAVGASVVFLDPHRLLDWDGNFAGTFFMAVLVLIASGIAVGTTLERSKFFPMLAVSAVMGAVVVPLAMHWVWNGWLNKSLGFVDLGGASIIHLTGATAAAVAAWVVGPRVGKYNRDGSSNMIPGHSVVLASAGVLTTLVGWFPYVMGCALLHSLASGEGNALSSPISAASDVLLAGAAGAAAGMLLGRWRYGTPDIYLTYAGLLGGLVAITASAGAVPSWAAVVIGAVAGFLAPMAMVQLDLTWKMDDPAGVIAVHGVGGLWGILSVGLFVRFQNSPSFMDRLRLIGVQAFGAVVIIALAAVAVFFVLAALRATVGLRLRDAEEFDGVDLTEHDLNAYPDFQQTTIKSYHLREQ